MGSLLSTAENARAGDTPTDLRPVLDDIRDLRDSLESYQGLEHSLVELAKTTEFNHNVLSERVADLREAIATLTAVTKNAALRPAQTGPVLGDNTGRSQRYRNRAAEQSRRRTATTMAIVVFAGILFTGWSIRAYLKTGNPYIAMLGLVVVNLAGCIAIMIRRGRG